MCPVDLYRLPNSARTAPWHSWEGCRHLQRQRQGRKLLHTLLQTSRTESVTLLLGLLLIVGFIFISYYPLARLMRLSYRN